MTTTIGQSINIPADKKGYTLVEIVIVMAISMIVLMMGLSAISFLSRSTVSLSNYVEMNNSGRLALEIISRDLRMGYDVNSASKTVLDFDFYGKGSSSVNVIYEYDADSKTVFRTEEGSTEEFLEHVESFEFKYFNLRREATTAIISIKEVQMEAVMKKTALSISNTNHIISARYMMRNRPVSD